MFTCLRARHIGNFAIEFVENVDHINPWDRIPRSQNIPKSLAYIGMESYWWEKCTWLSPKKPNYLILSWYLESISTWKNTNNFFLLGPKIQSNHSHSYLLSIFPTTRVACLGLRACIQNKSHKNPSLLLGFLWHCPPKVGPSAKGMTTHWTPFRPKVFFNIKTIFKKPPWFSQVDPNWAN